MANTFVREPIAGGDDNSWAAYLLAQTRAACSGIMSADLYMAGSSFRLSAGRIGIDDGTNRGVCVMDALQTIDYSGATNQNWAAVEVSVSGTSMSISVTDIAGATDITTLPVTFKNAFNPEKEGFYLTAAKRTIGLIWKISNLIKIIIICDGKSWFARYMDGSHYYKGIPPVINIGDWDMDASSVVTVNHNFPNTFHCIDRISIIVRYDSTTTLGVAAYTRVPLSYTTAGYWIMDPTQFILGRNGGGYFDNVDFNQTSYNRGWITVHFIDW